MGKQKKRKPTAKQTNRKRIAPLKRYNKIVSLVVKDNKKKGLEYNIADVRKQVSENIYPKLKNLPHYKIRLKNIKSIIGDVVPKEDEDTVRILAENVPREYFDITLEWFELGEENRRNDEINPILEMNRRYPDIPIVIKSGDDELNLKGLIGEYQNSKIQEFVELLRNKFKNKSGFIFSGVPTWFDRKDKQYALWGTEDVAENLPPENILDWVDAGEKPPLIRKKPKVEKDKQKDKPKDKPKPPKKEEPKKGLSDVQSSNLTKQLELLRDDYKDGIFTKDEYKLERQKLINKYEKGGKI